MEFTSRMSVNRRTKLVEHNEAHAREGIGDPGFRPARPSARPRIALSASRRLSPSEPNASASASRSSAPVDRSARRQTSSTDVNRPALATAVHRRSS